MSPSPMPVHQVVSANLFSRFRAACPSDYRVLYAPLDWQPDGTRSFEPDLLVMRREDVTRERLTGAPVLLVEIASPSTVRIDRTLKFDAYADAGVPQYWIVDPGGDGRAPSIEVYDLTETPSGATETPGAAAEYVLQARVTGTEEMTISSPVPVTVTPSALIEWRDHR